jgi:hypothetical protein
MRILVPLYFYSARKCGALAASNRHYTPLDTPPDITCATARDTARDTSRHIAPFCAVDFTTQDRVSTQLLNPGFQLSLSEFQAN